jgi:hypothetical protein
MRLIVSHWLLLNLLRDAVQLAVGLSIPLRFPFDFGTTFLVHPVASG